MQVKLIKKKPGRVIALAVAAVVLLAIDAPVSRAAYIPPISTLRIGLYYDSTALPSANLQNADGAGSGFEFGYYDGNRDFVPIGAWTDENAISMVIDRNMSWYPGEGGGAGEYREGTDGTPVLGCFHIMVDAYYETFEQAYAQAEVYSESFVKYDSGKFYVMIGQYTTRAEAQDAIGSRELSGCTINAGTSNTIVVVRTGTNRILFEFDYGEEQYLGVRPKPIDDEKSETWFKGYLYCGGFQYARRSGAFLTVVNFVEIEDYIKGILPYEMNNSWPMEALKAQACCSRSYAIASIGAHGSQGIDLCTTEHCQVYRGRTWANERTDQAVDETAGMYVTYNGELCTTYYASSNGGASENCENVWNDAIPYLKGVVDPYEADVVSKIPNYNWTVRYTPEELTQQLRSKGYVCATIVKMAVSAYTSTGNVLSVTVTDANGTTITLSKREKIISALGVPTQRFSVGNGAYSPFRVYVNDPPQAIETDMQVYALRSMGDAGAVPVAMIYAISGSGSVDIVSGEDLGTLDDNGMINGVFVIRGTGNGHSIGMSQWGAYSMAEYHGMNFIEIIKFYYTGVEVG